MERRAHLLEVLLGVHLVPNGVVELQHRGRVIPFLECGIGSTLEAVAVEDEADFFSRSSTKRVCGFFTTGMRTAVLMMR